MPYVIQAEEQEIGLSLLQDLAEILLAGAPDLTHADATYRIRRAGGLLPVEGRVEAERICAQFAERGVRCFVVDKLLGVPRPMHLNPEKPEVDGEVELAIAAWLHLVTEKVVTTTKLRLSLMGAMAGLPIPTRKTEEEKLEEGEVRYSLDLFTSGTHWRARPGYPQLVREILAKTTTPRTPLSTGARSLLEGKRNVPRFGKETDYEKYVAWLYQVRYAQPA